MQLDQATYDELQYLYRIENAYDEAIVHCRVGVGQVESIAGTRKVSEILQKAASEIEREKAPVTRKIKKLRAGAEAGQPVRGGWQSLG